MELALSLGETSKPFKFLDKPSPNNNDNNIIRGSKEDLGFCMGLSATSTAAHNNGGEEDDGHTYTRLDRPVQLDLLPFSPVHQPRRQNIPFPWLSENMVSEPSSTDGSGGGGRGMEVNRSSAEEGEEAAGQSSPNSAASSFQMEFRMRMNGRVNNNNNNNKRERESTEGERGSSRASDDEENGSARKKLRLSKQQSAFLEESFKEHSTLNPKQKLALAKELNLRPRQVEVWFQNRRARTKLKQTEVDCEYLKRCCETLTEENKRLQKELQELRALKISQPYYTQLPATTLTMCPSCERVATTTTATSSTGGAAGAGNNSSSPVAANASSTKNSTSFSLATKPNLYPFSSLAHLPRAQAHQAAS